VIEYFNPLWQYILKLAEKIGRKQPQPWQNWLATRDIRSLLSLTNFECVSSTASVLIPFSIPLISWISNKYLARLPIISQWALSRFIVARTLEQRDHNYSVSIVIPCRNEKGNIENAIHRIPHFASDQEIIFVEGHSHDGTYQEIQRVMSENPDMSLTLLRQPGTGKGDAVRAGFSAARNDVLMILDADLTVAPEDLPRFYNALVSQKGELINGTRLIYPMQNNAMQFFNMLANKLFSIVFSWLLDQAVTDTLCGTKVLMRLDYLRIADNRAYFGKLDPFGDFDLLFGAARLNLKIMDLPIRYRQRLYGSTNIRRWHHGWMLIRMVTIAANKLKFR
jgi:glycosyltransferase involved in cell wall biosynthesis